MLVVKSRCLIYLILGYGHGWMDGCTDRWMYCIDGGSVVVMSLSRLKKYYSQYYCLDRMGEIVLKIRKAIFCFVI